MANRPWRLCGFGIERRGRSELYYYYYYYYSQRVRAAHLRQHSHSSHHAAPSRSPALATLPTADFLQTVPNGLQGLSFQVARVHQGTAHSRFSTPISAQARRCPRVRCRPITTANVASRSRALLPGMLSRWRRAPQLLWSNSNLSSGLNCLQNPILDALTSCAPFFLCLNLVVL